jgi:Holliday junction resolvase RusA-like endonuclease
MPRSRKGKFARRDPSADRWQEACRAAAWAALEARSDAGSPEDELRARATSAGVYGRTPLAVTLVFRFARPTSHFLADGRTLAASVPVHLRGRPMAAKPDTDNLEKSTLDALGDWRGRGCLLWTDDASVCDVHVRKSYAAPGEFPGVDVTVRALPAS